MPKMLILKRSLVAVAGLLVILLIAFAFVYIAIQPPKLAVPQRQDLTLTNLTVWNPGSDETASQSIEVSGGIIAAIRSTGETDVASLCDGCFAMPGLIDAHVHTPPSIAIGNRELFSLLYLQHGVTSVRDLGQFDDDLPELVERLENGELAGPRMYHCGRILDGEPPSVPGAIFVADADTAKRVVAEHDDLGVDCIKVYGNLSAGAFQAVAEESLQRGLPLIGHTPNAISFNEIKNFESQHYTGIPYLEKPAPKGWAYKSQDLIDMTSSDVDAVLAVMVTNNISFLPTNANLLSRLTVSDPQRFPASSGFSHLPEFWEIAWPSIVSHPETDEEIETELAAQPAALSFIRRANENGVDVLVGTDVIMPYVIPGEAMYQQLTLMSEALGSREKALLAATGLNGRHVDPGKIGVLQTGAHADILLFKKDPRADISKIADWDYAIVGGRVYARNDVDDAVDRFDKHFRGWLYSTVMNTAYGFLAGDYEDSEVANH